MSKVKLKELVKSYESSYTLPKHPKTCPECGHKVKVFHMNILNPEQNSNNAIILCSNPIKNSCVWPLDTGRKDILGKSDVITLQKIVHEKKKLSKKPDENDNFEDQFNKNSEKNLEKYQNLIEKSEESPEILQESSHDLSTNSVDPDADTECESEGIQEAIDPLSDIDTDFMSLPEKEIQEISVSKEKEVSEEKVEDYENSQENSGFRFRFGFPPLIPQDEAFQSFNLSEIRKRKRKKKSQVQSWNAKGNTDVFQKIDEWQNKEADGQTGGTSNSYTQYGVY